MPEMFNTFLSGACADKCKQLMHLTSLAADGGQQPAIQAAHCALHGSTSILDVKLLRYDMIALPSPAGVQAFCPHPWCYTGMGQSGYGRSTS